MVGGAVARSLRAAGRRVFLQAVGRKEEGAIRPPVQGPHLGRLPEPRGVGVVAVVGCSPHARSDMRERPHRPTAAPGYRCATRWERSDCQRVRPEVAGPMTGSAIRVRGPRRDSEPSGNAPSSNPLPHAGEGVVASSTPYGNDNLARLPFPGLHIAQSGMRLLRQCRRRTP